MTFNQRIVLATALAMAMSAFTGVLSMAMHTPAVFPGMGVGLVLGAVNGWAMTSRRGPR